MHCACEELPVYTFYDEERGLSQKLRPFIVKVEQTNWRRLYRCELCGTHWRIDAADRLQHQFIWKTGSFREDWAAVEFVEEEKMLLLQCRGGETNEKCIWMGCEKKQVKGVAYCIDHLYATGARR